MRKPLVGWLLCWLLSFGGMTKEAAGLEVPLRGQFCKKQPVSAGMMREAPL